MEAIEKAAFDEGAEANENGDYRDACPYPVGAKPRTAWLNGWESIQPIREQWEASNHERAIQYREV